MTGRWKCCFGRIRCSSSGPMTSSRLRRIRPRRGLTRRKRNWLDAYPDRLRRLAPASQWRGVDSGANDPGGRRIGRFVRIPHLTGHVDRSPAFLPGNSPRDPILAAYRPAHRGSQAGPYPHRHGRPDRLADATLLPHAQADLHHQLSHPLPRICVGADPRSRMADLCRVALFSRAFGRSDGADADDRRRPHPPRLPPGSALDSRRQSRGLPAAVNARARPAAAYIPVGWTGGGGKEPRSAARPRFARLHRRRRRRTGSPPARATLSARAFPWRQAGGSARRHLCERGRVRLPLAPGPFRIVMIEAKGRGLPVAAYPVPGPIDVVGPSAGVLDEDLRAACLKALTLSREQAREHSMRFTWKESARQFLDNIEASRSDVKLPTVSSPKTVGVVRPVENR